MRTYQTPREKLQPANFVLEIRNEIVNTIARKILLPQAMLVMFSSKQLEDPVFAIECMEGMIRWLLDEIEEIIKYQKRCLPDKSKSIETPRVYFLKIIPKPSNSANITLFKGVRRKFNTMLQEMLHSYHYFGFINVHEITTRPKDEKFFISDQSGTLSDEGTIQLWESISQTFKAMDQRCKPKLITKTQATQWDPKDFEKSRSHHDRERTYRHESFKSKEYRHYDDDRYAANTHYNHSYYY